VPRESERKGRKAGKVRKARKARKAGKVSGTHLVPRIPDHADGAGE